jgi:ribonuclease-3 family protein
MSHLLPLEQIRRLSPVALAYLGDALYEVHVRSHYLFPPQRIEGYHQQVVARVRGSAQAALLQALLPYLSEEEQSIIRWGSNGSGRPPRNLTPSLYRQASGFETLLGYLYLSCPQRLQEILTLTDRLTEA